MASAFSQSTFLSADGMEPSAPHLPPILVGQGGGTEQGGAARAHSSCPQNICLDPVLA